MRLFLLSALCSLLSALPVTAQTKQVIKGISDNALTESLVVPSGKTLTINSGGSIVNNGTATGFSSSMAIGSSPITGGTSGHVLYNNSGTLGGLALNASAVGLGNVSNALQLVAANNLSDLTNAVTARTNLGLGTLATQSATITDYLTTATAASTYAPLASPTFTGTVTIPSGASIAGYAPLASPTFTGTVRAPTFTTVNAFQSTRTITMETNLGVTWNDFNGTGFSVTVKPNGTPSGNSTVNLPVSGDVISTGDTNTVTSTMITDGTIVNADINASAAIAISKLASSTSAALGLGTLELGHATDTTLARVSAGVASIEGATIATLSTANVFTQTQSIPGITGTGGGGLYLLINGNSTSGSMVGVSGYMPGFTTGSAGGIGFSSGAPSSGYDTFFTRDSAAVMQLGSDGASPTSYQLKSADGTGTNTASSNLTFGGSRSTGTGAGGDVIVITSMSGSSGTSANTTQERSRIIGRFVNLTEATATNFASIALASGKVTGGTATITVWASDGTDHQSLTSEIRFAAVNKAGTITATVSQTDGTTAASAGTLTVTYDATQSGSAVLLRANATSSLTQTILRTRCVITALNGDDTQTVTPQ